MNNIKGHCYCGAVQITIREYGNFIYACHCRECRRINSGPIFSVDPGPKENVIFNEGEDNITIFPDDDVERAFCSTCGTTLYWYDPAKNHICMNAELFDAIIEDGSFELELFYDSKPEYYSFEGRRNRLNHKFEKIE